MGNGKYYNTSFLNDFLKFNPFRLLTFVIDKITLIVYICMSIWIGREREREGRDGGTEGGREGRREEGRDEERERDGGTEGGREG